MFGLYSQGYSQIVEAGESSSFYICSDNSVWAFGENSNGILGDSTDIDRMNPVLIFLPEDSIVDISCGQNHAMALNSSGEVFSWGSNYKGQLGNGTFVENYIPEKVNGLTDVVRISAGGEHSMALTSDGTVWTWGENHYGRLGTGDTIDQNVPTELVYPHIFIEISAGGYHSLALTNDGQIYAWGRNLVGELGDNTTVNKLTPTPAIHSDSVVAISAGFTGSSAITSNGKLLVWGNNAMGQYGNGTMTNSSIPVYSNIDSVIMVDASRQHILVLRSDSTVWGMGVNYPGTLGDGIGANSNVPTQAIGLYNIRDIGAGGFHSLAVGTSLYGFGTNSDGELGSGADPNLWQLTPYESPFSCLASLGINSIPSHSEINVYPNPFISFVTIEFDNPGNEFYELYLFDMQGREIRHIDKIDSGLFTFHREDIEPGMYTFHLMKDGIVYNSGKLIAE